MIRAFVISSNRPMNVPLMKKLTGANFLTWVVPEDQVGEYKQMGAAAVPDGGGLCQARNEAIRLNRTFGGGEEYCLQLSDDLTALRWATTKSNADRVPLPLNEAVMVMKREMNRYGAKLAGVAPTDNAFFFNPNKPITTDAFIVGDLMLIAPDSDLCFDESLKLKEDYDYTLQHLTKYGKVARVNNVLASFKHRTNRGGAVAYRTPEREQEAIAYLKGKWPGAIVDNPRRENEVLLRWK